MLNLRRFQVDPTGRFFLAWQRRPRALSWAPFLDPDRSHRLAHAATHATQRGMAAGQAADIGLQAVGLKRETKKTFSWSADPGVRSTVIGAACLFALFFLPFYFIVLPVLGLLYAIRSFGTGRFYFAVAGLALNGLATLLAALVFFNLI